MARDPEYGVPKTADELDSEDPRSVLYGVTPSDQFIPIRIDADGRLLIGSDVTLVVDDVDLNIRALDPENGNASQNLSAENLGVGNGFALRTAIFNGANQLGINGDGSLNVNVVSAVPSDPVNEYAAVSCPPSVETTVVSYVVPALKTLTINGFVGWGDYDGEFLIKINSVTKGGGRTSGASRTLTIDYSHGPLSATAGQTVTITALVDSHAGISKPMKANLLGSLS